MLFRKNRIAGIITMIPGITLAICMLCFTGEFISDIIKEVKPEIWPMTDDDRFYEAVTDSSTEKMADMLQMVLHCWCSDFVLCFCINVHLAFLAVEFQSESPAIPQPQIERFFPSGVLPSPFHTVT